MATNPYVYAEDQIFDGDYVIVGTSKNIGEGKRVNDAVEPHTCALRRGFRREKQGLSLLPSPYKKMA